MNGFSTPPNTIGYYWFITSETSIVEPEVIYFVRKITGELFIERFGGLSLTLSDFVKKYPKGIYKKCHYDYFQ